MRRITPTKLKSIILVLCFLVTTLGASADIVCTSSNSFNTQNYQVSDNLNNPSLSCSCHSVNHSEEQGLSKKAHRVINCSSCGGNGKCWPCKGTGIQPTGNGEKCSICNGSKKCYVCSGTGEL
jgi:hypothetical protein